nr:hypothetical protein [uncultured Rhodoferax sp.]
MPITAANGIAFSDSQIQSFFAGKPSLAVIAVQAAYMGLGVEQIRQALSIGGQNVSATEIAGYATQHGYSWGANGTLTAPASHAGGLAVAGRYYTPQQISEFLTQGGDLVLFAQQSGMSNPMQINALVAEAMAISTAWVAKVVGTLTTEQIAALTTAQVAAARTDQVAALTTNQIVALTTAQVAALRTDQLAALTVAQVAAFSQQDIAALSPAAIAVLGTKLVDQSQAAPEPTIATPTTQVPALVTSPANNGVLTTAQIAALPTSLIASLSPQSISFMSTEQFAALTTAQVAALTTEQIQLGVTVPLVTVLRTDQAGALSSIQVVALTTNQLGALETQDIAALTTSAIGALTTHQVNLGLSTNQIAALTTAQVVALRTDQAGALGSSQVRALRTEQLSAMETRDVAALNTSAVGALTTTQIVALRTNQVSALNTRQVVVLSTEQLGAMETQDIAALSTAAVGALTTDQISQGLASNQFAALTTAQVVALSTDQINAGVTTNQVAAMTTEQVVALQTQQVIALRTDAVAAFTTDGAAVLDTQDISVLTTAQIQVGLTTNQVVAMTTDQIAALTPEQVMALSPEQYGALSTDQIAQLALGSPIVLDLNGAGISTLGITQGVQFDIYGNGQPVQTGWVSPGDGLLVLDRNKDGSINGGAELFGEGTNLANGRKATNGYQALAELDTDGDGYISAADTTFSELMVWVDGDSDGVSETSELHSLESLNIAQLNLAAQSTFTVDNGNVIGLASNYTTTDGSTHDMVDVWFATSAATTPAPVPHLQLPPKFSGSVNSLNALPLPEPKEPVGLPVPSMVDAMASFMGSGDVMSAHGNVQLALAATPPLAPAVANDTGLQGVVEAMRQFDANGQPVLASYASAGSTPMSLHASVSQSQPNNTLASVSI